MTPFIYVTENASHIAFKTSWASKQMAENDFFMIGSSHAERYPDLLREMSDAHSRVLIDKLYQSKNADSLFFEAYLNPLINCIKSVNAHSKEINDIMVDRALLEKHKITKDQRRTWDAPR